LSARLLLPARPCQNRFGIGFNRWSLRVHAYLLLMTDAYPPFSLD